MKFNHKINIPKITYRGDSPRPFSSLHLLLQKELGLSYIASAILTNRGISTLLEARNFLRPTLKEGLPSPRTIKNIDKAVEIILDFTCKKSKITVFTDFDVDGLTSGAQLVLFLKSIGAHCDAYTPSRFSEGYGLNEEAIKKLAITGTNLLITVDCGIANYHEIALAKKLGLSCVIIDHHLPTTIPPADVVVNPAQDGCAFQEYALSAAGLVWMLLIVMKGHLESHELFKSTKIPDPKEFLDLAAIGTICDMVPLNKVNRVIASRGLEVVHKTTRPGLVALKEMAGIRSYRPISGSTVAFAIGPRINAAGRLRNASEVFELLTTGNKDRAKQIARKIETMNTKRKSLEEEIKDNCVKQILSTFGDQLPPAFAIYGEDFHIGVIGIVAQRVVELFNRPAAIMGPSEILIDGKLVKVAKGSVRSIRGFNVSEVLHSLDRILISGGGHAAAGGFSITLDNIESFRAGFIQAGQELLTCEDLLRSISVDTEVTLNEISFPLAEEIEQLAPFGIGNPTPLFLARNIEIGSVTPMSRNHARLRIQSGEYTVNAVAWGFLGHPMLKKGTQADIVFSTNITTYSGLSSLQLDIKEIMPTHVA